MQAKDIMTTKVITVSPEDTVEQVMQVLAENGISGVPVVNDLGQPVGIVSEGDLLVRAQNLRAPAFINILGGIIYLDDPEKFKQDLKKLAAYQVKDLMTENPFTVEEETSVERIATLMAEEGINRVPVVRNGKLVGIITRADIVRSLAGKGSQ